MIFAVKPAKTDIDNHDQGPGTSSALLRWWDAFPTAIEQVSKISREEVLGLVKDPQKKPGVDYAIIDTRGDDHKVRSSSLS
jgi:hypothetical protein